MSEIHQFLPTTLQRHIGVPMTEAQRMEWEGSVQRAYQELWGIPAFQVVLEHWIVGVLLVPCDTLLDEGRRRFVLDVIRLLAESQHELPMHIDLHHEEA